jgi:hypothetical protein
MAWRVHFSEFFHYDITLDADIARISIADPHGREYFARVPSDGIIDGMPYRARRDRAISAILSAMKTREPGEVEVEYGLT